MTILSSEDAAALLRKEATRHGSISAMCRDIGRSESFVRDVIGGRKMMSEDIADMLGLARQKEITYTFSAKTIKSKEASLQKVQTTTSVQKVHESPAGASIMQKVHIATDSDKESSE